MDLVIHSYGYSELIFHALSGLAMFRNSNFYPTIINGITLMVGTFYAIKMSSSSVEGEWRRYLKQVIMTVIFVNSLLLPKSSMLIKDHVEKSFYKVDNIPLAFALPISIVESFGHLLTMGFEQTFSLVGSRSSNMYYHYGTVFGARLAKEVMQAKIRDPEVVSNMRNFLERCVILPSMIGHKFTKEELFASDNIWDLVSKNAGELTRTDMVINNVRQSPSPTCKEAVRYFESKFQDQNTTIISNLSRKFRGAGSNEKYNEGLRQLNTNMKAAIQSLYGGGVSVDSILKNNMLINGINDWRSGKYASARAQMQQEAGGLLSGDMAEKTLTGSLAVMKVFIYAAFIFLFPLLIVSGGISKYLQWITMAFSLSLWPPLFSILNMIIDFAYDPPKIVSYSTWSTETKKMDAIASLAANLTISIPFLAYWITKMGEGGFMHLAGSIMATAHSAANAVASEKATGARNWDNTNIGNSSIQNHNAYKTNHNLEYLDGENGWTTSDGARVKMAARGNEIISGGAGITSDTSETRYSLEDSRRAEATIGASRSMEMLEADTRSLATAKTNTLSKTKDWIKNIAERESAGEAINYESMGEDGKNVQQIVNTTKTLAKDYGYSFDQAAEASLSGSASLGIGGIASMAASGSMSAANRSSQGFSEREAIENNNLIINNLNSATKAAINHSHSKDTSIDKTSSDTLRSAYEEQERCERAISRSRHEANSWQEAKHLIDSSAGSSSKDMTRDVIDRYMVESGVNDRVLAHKHVSERTPEVLRVWSKMQEEDEYVRSLASNIASSKSNASKDVATNSLDDFSSTTNLKEGSNDHIVSSIASENNLTNSSASSKLGNVKQDLDQKYKNIQSNTDNQSTGIEYGIKQIRGGLQQRVDKYEKDRIGRGSISRLGGAFESVTGVHSLVGGPKKEESMIDQSVNQETNGRFKDLEEIGPEVVSYNGEK